MTFPILASSWLRFEQPWWLAAATAAVLPAIAATWARRRGRHVAAFSVLLQCAAVVLAAAAVARPGLPLGERADRPWMVLRDVSASVKEQFDRPWGWPADLAREEYDFAETVAAAGRPVAEGATRVTAALQLAGGRAKDIAGLVLITDGHFQDADWSAAAEALGRAGMRVFIVPLESPPADARIADLSAQRRSDGKVDVRVTVVSNAMQERTLRVLREGRREELLLREMSLLPNEPATIRLIDDAPADRAATYRAALLGKDAFPQNDQAAAAALPLRQTVAVVAAEADALAKTIEGAMELPVKPVAPAEAPADAAAWMDYSAVVLVDAKGTLLSERQRAAVAAYVRGGGGLILIGAGPHASPQDRDDPLNRVAALIANPYERKPLKVTVVLDASGSMGEPAPQEAAPGRQIKFQLAAEAVLALKRHLTPADALAVVTFAVSPQRVYDSKDAPPNFGAVHDALFQIQPAGGNPTRVMPALALAAQDPAPQGKDGLVILVSDLLTEPYDANAVAQVGALLRRGRCSLSIVAVRTGVSSQPVKTGLEALAGELKATVVTSDSLTGLAEIFAGFLRSVRGDAVRSGRFQALLIGSPFGLSGLSLPELDAYLLCAQQEGAEPLAAVEGRPLLAARRLGLGRSVGLAVPLGAGQNAALRGSEAFLSLLASAARWAGGEQGDPRFSGRAERGDGRLHVRIDARDRDGPMTGRSLVAEVLRLESAGEDPNRLARTPLVQTSPGRYEADLPAADEPLGLVVSEQGTEGRVVYRQGVGLTCPAEFAAIGADWGNLRRLAELSGGQIIPPSHLSSLARQWDRRRFTPVWPYVLAGALVLILLEWSIHRIWRQT